jgi:hypothetical protein
LILMTRADERRSGFTGDPENTLSIEASRALAPPVRE